MIVDIDEAPSLPLAGHYDLCIAGAGVAGIVLANVLAKRGKRILLLEGGGPEYSEDSQNLYKGSSVGRPYFELDIARLRYFGGTSNHWGGRCRPLDAHDLERRDHIEDSGWPIGIADLQPYLAKAQKIMKIDAFSSDVSLEDSNRRLNEIFFNWSPPVRFGDDYKDALAANEGIDVFLNANLTDIEIDPDSGRVSAVVFQGFKDGAPVYRAKAGQYVLALGGIENARALLNANRQAPQGLGNDNDLVGRYFLEHPHNFVGYYVADSAKTRFGDKNRIISPSAEMIRRERIANAGFQLLRMDSYGDGGFMDDAKELFRQALCASEEIADFIKTYRPLRCRPNVSGVLRVASEQVPNRNSRVMLSNEIDRFGWRRVALDWRLSPMDKRTVRIGAMEIAKYFARQDIGRVKLFDWVLEEGVHGPTDFRTWNVAAYHHMGTTRMGMSKQDGVVDRDCRVFGIENLYIAGSSVFRTGGHANPTFTILQLALRLGDHLANTKER